MLLLWPWIKSKIQLISELFITFCITLPSFVYWLPRWELHLWTPVISLWATCSFNFNILKVDNDTSAHKMIWDTFMATAVTHFIPCGSAYRSDAFFLICSYTRRSQRPGQRVTCFQKWFKWTFLAASKHMRWATDLSFQSSAYCTYSERLAGAGHSQRCLSSYLHVLKDSSIHHSGRVWPLLSSGRTSMCQRE